MKICFCRTILAVAVIVLVWWNPSWMQIGVTIAAGILGLMSLFGVSCCCNPVKCDNKK